MLRRSDEHDLSETSSAINSVAGEQTPLITRTFRAQEMRPMSSALLARFEADVEEVSDSELERREEESEAFRNRVAEIAQEQPALSLRRRRILAAIDLFINSMNMLAFLSSTLLVSSGFPNSYEEIAERIRIIAPILCVGAFGLNVGAMRSDLAAKFNNLVLALNSGVNVFTLVFDYSVQFTLAAIDRSGARINITDALFFGAFVAPNAVLGGMDAAFNLALSEDEQERRAQASPLFRGLNAGVRSILASGTLFSIAMMIAESVFDLDKNSQEDDPEVTAKLYIGIGSIIAGIVHELACIYFKLSPQRLLDSLAQIVFMNQNLNRNNLDEMPEFLRTVYILMWPAVAVAATLVSINMVKPEVVSEPVSEIEVQEINGQPEDDNDANHQQVEVSDLEEGQPQPLAVNDDVLVDLSKLFGTPEAQVVEEPAVVVAQVPAVEIDRDPETSLAALFNDDFQYSPGGTRFKLFSRTTPVSSSPTQVEDRGFDLT